MERTTTKDKAVNLVRALVHGESGVGKTTSLGTLPEDRTVIAAAERSLLALADRNYEVLLIKSWDDVREMVRTFMEPYKIGERAASVLAIDSLSEFSELCKKQIVTVDRKALVKERTNDKRETPEKVYDDLMTQEDWGLYGNRMLGMISAVCHLPVNIVFTCLSSWTEDKRTGSLHIAPDLNGKSALKCPAYFDCVFYMRSDEKGLRSWQTFNDGQIIAKAPKGVEQYEEPDWSKVFRKVLGGKNGGGK